MVERSPRTGLPIIKKEPPRWSTRCAGPPPPELLAAVEEFNAGRYWECHEGLEAIWRAEPDPIRSLYQGILLVGVGYLHWRRGNGKGAAAKLAQGLERLAPFQAGCLGLDIAVLTRAARDDLARLEAAAPGEALPALVPPRIARLPAQRG